MYKILLGVAIGLGVFFSLSTPASAARNTAQISPTNLGIDISYPQCGKTVPKNQVFGVVGVNGGVATTTNGCLKDQLIWGNKSLGGTAQDKVQLYVNTANPGGLGTTSWPTSGSNQYGTCDGTDSLACAFQYGWNRADEDINTRFIPAANQAGINPDASAYKWWLDVETMNTWKPTTTTFNKQSNTAVLEGFAAKFVSSGARVGLYSTAYQWTQITGDVISGVSNLNGLDNWRPGGANQSTAKQACSANPLTSGGKIVLTQFISKNIDYDYVCS